MLLKHRQAALALLFAIAVAVPLAPLAARAQPQITCAPGTNVCTDGQGHVFLRGSAGPGGATGTGTATGTAQGNGNAPYAPLYAPFLPPQQNSTYRGPYTRITTALAACPAMRAGLGTGFRFGGGTCLEIVGAHVGFGIDAFAVAGGVGSGITELSLHPSVIVRFVNADGAREGFFVRGGAEAMRIGLVHGTSEVRWHMGVEVGGGYDVSFGSFFWRVLELRPYIAFRLDPRGTPDDAAGRKQDYGALVLTGIGFD